MLPDKIKKILKKQPYVIIGDKEHSAVQVCRWTKKSLRDEGVCYKEKFYGIKSHLCCQMTPSLWCPNKCIHCWRAIELTTGKEIPGEVNTPAEIINGCIKAQRKLIEGFKILPETKDITLSKANMKKWQEAQEPMQFAISLSGEPTLYPMIGDLISELRKRGKTSFLVSNGLHPEKLEELKKKKQLPTQLYISVNTPNEKMYNWFHRSIIPNAWKKLNESLNLMRKLKDKTRTIFRMNLVKDLNMEDKHILEYAELIKKAKPLCVEIKGFMSVGFARQRLGYERMPTYEDMLDFSKKLAVATGLKVLDTHEFSRAIVLSKNKKDLKIKKKEI